MGNMHRIQWFDQQIREGCYPNSHLLAEQFEISRRQAQRDIEYLMISLRAPLSYVAQKRGYCYEDKAYVLPYLYMTEEEKQVLKFLAFRYRQYNYENAEAVQRIAHLLDRFIDEPPTAGPRRLPVFDTDETMMQSFQLVSHAIQQHCIVDIVYRESGKELQLRIHPFKLVSQYTADYVVAYCEQQGMQRALRLDGIRRVTVTDDHFDPASEYTDDWIEGARTRKKPFIAKMRLSERIAGGIWKGYPAQAVNEDDAIYEVQFYDIDSFMQHLLLSDWQQLLAPKWLLAKLRSRCQTVLDRCEPAERT